MEFFFKLFHGLLFFFFYLIDNPIKRSNNVEDVDVVSVSLVPRVFEIKTFLCDRTSQIEIELTQEYFSLRFRSLKGNDVYRIAHVTF